MKHWLGVLLIAVVLAGVGLLVSDETQVGDSIRSGLVGGGMILGLIALFKIASGLMRSDSTPN